MLAIALAVAAGWKASTGLRFVTDRNDMFAVDAPYHHTFLRFQKEFGIPDDIVVVLSGARTARNHDAARRLADRLRADPVHFESAYERLELGFVRRRLLYFMSVSELEDLERNLKQARPLLARVLGDPGLAPLFVRISEEVQAFVDAQIEQVLHHGASGGAPAASHAPAGAEVATSLPILTRLLRDMTDSLAERFTYRSPWPELLSTERTAVPDLTQDAWFDFQDGRVTLILVRPRLQHGAYNPNAAAVDALNADVAVLRREMPDVDVGVTGKAVMENDEMEVANQDSEKATALSLVGVVLLFSLTYRRVGRPFLAMICLGISLSWSMGFAALAIGHLNVLSVTVMPMLVGLGIDFGIQIITRYEEERVLGLEPEAAMAETLGGTGGSVFTAGLTTAVSFLAVRVTGFRGIEELAWLASAGIVLSVLAMVVVLPTMLLLADRHPRIGARADGLRALKLSLLARVEAGLLSHPYGVVFLGMAFTLACLGRVPDIRFDSNVLNMQRTEVVQMEKRFEALSGRSLLFAEVVADDLEQARLLERRLIALPTVQRVESVVPLLPEDQDEKQERVQRIRAILDTLPPMRHLPQDVDVSSLGHAIADLRSVFLLIYPEARATGQLELCDGLREFVAQADRFLERMFRMGFGAAAHHLLRYQRAFFGDLMEKITLIRAANEMEPMHLEDLPPVLHSTLMSRRGRLLLNVFPREDVWERPAMRRFLADVRSVDPDATGAPVEVYESTGLMQERYPVAAAYAFLAILAVVLLQFRGLLPTLLVLTPLLFGVVWMGGIQGMFGLTYNPANYIAFSLILGIGVANGIYIVRRFQEEGSAAIFTVSTGRAILLSNLTAMMGFGSLMAARHHGMFSVGQVMTVGIAACMVASLVFLPALLRILAINKVKV